MKKHIFKTLIYLMLFLCFNLSYFESKAAGLARSDMSISYNPCNGLVTFTGIFYINNSSIFVADDYMSSLSLFYENSVGNDVLYWKFRDWPDPGTAWNYPPLVEGRQFYYHNYISNITRLQTHNNGTYRNVVRAYIPYNAIYSNGVITIRAMGYFDGVAFDEEYTIVVNPIETPTNLVASNNIFCDKVELSWSNDPNLVNCANSQSVFDSELFRDGVSIYLGNATSYDDTSATPGKEHKYTLKTILQPSSNIAPYSTALSAQVIGKRFGSPIPPSGLDIEQDGCNGKLKLKWDWQEVSNPKNFLLERSSDTTFLSKTLHTLGGGLRNYTDNTVNPGDEFYYRLFAQDVCPNDSSKKLLSPNTEVVKEVGNGSPTAASIDTVYIIPNNQIKVLWTDNSTNESGFVVERSSSTGVFSQQLNMGVDSFIDKSIQFCTPYTYTIKAINTCAMLGVVSTNTKDILVPADLSQTFTSSKKVAATKGLYGDKVRLSWSNNNSNQINSYQVHRINPALNDTVLLGSVPSGFKTYDDNTCDANTLYNYQVIAETNCGNDQILSNVSEDQGFRLAFGTINGQINYAGGIAVKGVKVAVNPTAGITGKSMKFDGLDDKIMVPHTSDFGNTSFTFQAFINVDTLSGKQIICSKKDSSGGWQLYLDASSLVFNMDTSYLSIMDPKIESQQFVGISVSYDGNYMRIYLDGEIKDSLAVSTDPSNTSDLLFGAQDTSLGAAYHYKGILDEIRYFKRALSKEEIWLGHDVYINPASAGLMGYWRVDAGFGNQLYDYSKVGALPNQNHGQLINAVWDSKVPTANQLAPGAYTDSLGSYFIPFIPFSASGENFNITPIFGTHSFSPAIKTLFIGGNSVIYNNQDFTDNSSFRTTGSVKYDSSSCFVEGAYIKLDNEIVIRNGLPVETKADGTFDLQVPIGHHVLTVEKNGHYFSTGRFPPSGTWDFQQNVTISEPFIDSTLIKVVGRVVGGEREGSKLPGMGLSKNNIGKTAIVFQSQQNNGCYTDTVLTDASTGEYEVSLPPLKFIVPDFAIHSNLSIEFENNNLLDLSTANVNMPITLYDSTEVGGVIIRSDSVEYHKRRDFNYFAPPSINLTNEDGSLPIRGDSMYEGEVRGKQILAKVDTLNLPYPVFSENRTYKLKVSAFEIYTNNDDPLTTNIDSVPVSTGKISFINKMSADKEHSINLRDTSLHFEGTTIYEFIAGNTNTVANSITPVYSYTQTLEAILETPNYTVAWEPNTGDGTPSGLFRGIVFGGRALGASFATKGPEVVTMILRDPPGSESSASWESGVTNSYSFGVEVGLGGDISIQKEATLGTKMSFGVGITTETEITNTLTGSVKLEVENKFGTSFVESLSRNTSISTGSSSDFVGTGADLFYGRSMNMDYGLAESLQLIDSADCSNSTVKCEGLAFGGYRLGTQTAFTVIPGGYETEFVYSQDFIENQLIPNLEKLRNNLFVSDSNYVSLIPSNHPNYGTSNDDLIWGANATPEPYVYDDNDTIGYSYHYKGSNYQVSTVFSNVFRYLPSLDSTIVEVISSVVSYPTGTDSVWFYNQQVRLWQETLMKNEKAKVDVQASDKIRNISYSAGNTYNYAETSNREITGTHQYSVALTEELKFEIGASVGGIGSKVTFSASTKLSLNTNASISRQTSTTTAYSISDNNSTDYFSVDVFKPNDGYGPIFKTRGGETSCPHQAEEKSKYYNVGTVINQGTIAKELPGLDIVPSVLYNVPAESQAIFNIDLKNLSPAGEDATYSLKVMEASNPNGAIVTIDGLTPNRDFGVPAGTSISKQLSISKGQLHIDYDSLMFIFHSSCQFDIADTAYASVHFLPSCTEIEISSPNNQFVLNNSFKDSLPILIDNYNINYGGLDKIRFEYKPASQASWVPIQSWYKDTTGYNDPTTQEISTSKAYTSYYWNMAQLIDQEYNIRAVSTCNIPGVLPTDKASTVLAGIADRVNPHPFGSPTPVNGILSPSDDISIQFNEEIEAGSLTPDNFDLNAVLNGQPLLHSTSMSFDGIAEKLIIPNGLNFSNSSFTIEFWLKRNSKDMAQTILSQGVDAAQSISISFDATNHLVFMLGNQTLSTQDVYADTINWHHWAISYDKTGVAEIMYDGSSIDTDNAFYTSYSGNGKTYIAMDAVSKSNFFNGSLHELRIWNRSKTLADIVTKMNISLTGRELKLSGYWPLEEGRGTVTEDKARYRNAEVDATWLLLPSSKSMSFDGINDYLQGPAGLLAISPEMDMSIEFWFKSAGNNAQAFLSNGSGRYAIGDANRTSWSIEATLSNTIIVRNDSLTFNAVTANFFDNNWHHFALVLDRNGNLTAYIDGNQQNNVSSSGLNGFGSSKLWIACRGWFNGVTEMRDRYFNGSMDEVRIWNSARLQEQIELEMYNRLDSKHTGLIAYYPFEHYESVLGVPSLQPATTDESIGTTDLSAENGADYSNITPPIKLQRPVQAVNYNWSVNKDKIVINCTEDPSNIENVTLSISVKNVKDLHGNYMQSPKSWIAYVDKNQVLWQDQQKNLEKRLNDSLSFSTKIINRGGELKNYSITNIPSWLQASSTSGSIAPLSQKTITFTVVPSINIGDYSQDIHLSTNFGYDEKLLVNLKVYEESPIWIVDPSQFQFSMSIIAQIRINNLISTNPGDKVVAFVNGQVRGVGQLNYIEEYDNYQVYLDVYSNLSSGDSIEFMVWSASLGKTLVEVEPDDLLFTSNTLLGTPSNPFIFDAFENISLPIVLNKGWTWFCLPLINDKLSSVSTILKNVNAADGDIVKNQTDYDQSYMGNWIGSLSNTGGFTNNSSYKIKISQADTLDFTGVPHDPDTVIMEHKIGWNWIAYIPTANQSVNVAMNSYSATEGDLLKSQTEFAYYDAQMGWIGSLKFMKPAEGYLLKSAKDGSYTYPRAGLFRIKDEHPSTWKDRPFSWQVDENKHSGNTNMIITVDICDKMLQNNRFAIGAFSDEVCKGLAFQTIHLKDQAKEVFFLTLSAETNEKINFKIYDRSTGDEYLSNFEMIYRDNELYGSVEHPIKMEFSEKIPCLEDDLRSFDENKAVIFPNPFTHETSILLPTSMQNENTVTVTIYTVLGKVVKQYHLSNTTEIQWQGKDEMGNNLPSGLYHISFENADRKINQKIVKLN